MPFPTLTSAGFTAKEDSQFFREKMIDPTIRKEIEGGFVVTRRRFTRTVKEITTGFTDISDDDKIKFDSFLAGVGVGANSFNYIHPVSGATISVRFREAPTIEYAGMGQTRRWNIRDLKLETV